MISTLKKLLFVFLLPVSLAAQDEGFLYVRGRAVPGPVRVRAASASMLPARWCRSPARLFGHPVTMLPTALRTSLAADPQGDSSSPP